MCNKWYLNFDNKVHLTEIMIEKYYAKEENILSLKLSAYFGICKVQGNQSSPSTVL